MTAYFKPISRLLQYEIVGTHDEGFSVIYSKWNDEAKTKFTCTIGRTQELEKLVTRMVEPIDTRLPLKTEGKDQKWFPLFVDPDKLAKIQDQGGLTSRDYDLYEAFKPKTWGEAPDPKLILIGVSHWDNTFIHPDGTYAVTSYGDSTCWSYWKRKKLTALIKSGEHPIKFNDESYFVPGNGDMFSFVFTLTEPEYATFREEKTFSYDRLGYALRLWGYDDKDFRKDDDE